jgi:hypothetical protein
VSKAPADILLPASDDQIDASLIAYLQSIPGFPVSDWENGGVMKTIVELEKLGMGDLFRNAIPAMLGAGVLDFCNDAWIGLLAAQLYHLTRTTPVLATQTLTLSCDSSHGPYTITAGQLWFKGLTGNRWNNTSGGTLSTGGTLSVNIAAEGPGASYNDPAGTIKKLDPQLPGVTCVNVASDFSPIVPGLLSSGTVAASRTSGGTPPTQASFILRIDAAGQVGAGGWSYSTDGGKSFLSAGVIGTTDLLLNGVASGTRVTFTNGGGNPSFVTGDLFSFSTPGSSFITVGKDQESFKALVARCKARWPDLTAKPTQSRYLKWAKAASAEVTRVRLEEDASYAGRLKVTLAGLAGAVTGGAVTAVQAYMDPRAPIGRIILAQAATTAAITASGTVTVPYAKKVAMQAAAQTAWQTKLFATDIGGRVRVADLVKAVMDTGAIDFQGAQVAKGAGSPVSTFIDLATTEVAVLPSATPLLANQLFWKTV